MTTEAIILAGGLGTRLREAVPDLPKAMAPVAGRPFLSYVIDYLRQQGVEHIIFALGYKHEVIQHYLEKHYPSLSYTCVIEDEPLGTGGAIQLALQQAKTDTVAVTNGDTLFRISLRAMEKVHHNHRAVCTMALKPMRHFERYGVVTIDEQAEITSFKEKQFYSEGLISGGFYLIDRERFLSHLFPPRFSIEKDFLEKEIGKRKIFGSIQDAYFIDIGIPEDFEKAQHDFKKAAPELRKIDKSWSLFLDRDGVINNERVGNYVLNWKEFRFSDGVLEAFSILGNRFGHIFIVSNQRGVEKGLMTKEDLADIHARMLEAIGRTGTHVDKIYYCTAKDDRCFRRKPNPGMAVQAFSEFAGVDPEKSIMVGNKPSDMRFGRSAGMHTVFLTTTNPNEPFPHPDTDLRFDSLLQFAKALEP
jgi:D-glycero-alpha-D-manno-heptose 1-phosphate guanylyltransferase